MPAARTVGGVHLFTYGSLMFPAVWTRVVAGSYRSLPASLPGFRRRRVRGEDYPGLERADVRTAGEDPAAMSVDGILYLDVAPADLDLLDEFEGADYRRIEASAVVRREPTAAGRSALEPGAAVATTAPGPGAVLPAQTYLFVSLAKLERGDWDPLEFERKRITRFLLTYPPLRVPRA
jgi:hypothetical protein